MGDVSGALQSVGQAAGQVLGGVGGFLGKSTGYDQYSPNQYGIDRAAFDPSQQEQSFVDSLMARSQGNAPSVAEMQMKRGLDQSTGQAIGLASSQRGISPGLAARLAAQSQASNQNNFNAKAGELRAQEQMQNDQLLGQSLQSQRQSRMARESLASGQGLGYSGIESGAYEGSANRGANLIKGIGQAFGVGGLGKSHGGMIGYADGGMISNMQQSGQQSLDDITTKAYQLAMAYAKPTIGTQLDTDWSKTPMKKEAPQAPQSIFNQQDNLVKPEPQAFGAARFNYGQVQDAAFAEGGQVPGKAFVSGDHEMNDLVPAMLSPGEVVIPRSVVNMAPDKIAQFVMALRGGV